MVNVFLSHQVADFAAWEKVFKEGEALRVKHGVKTLGVYQGVEKTNDVTVVTEFPSMEAVNGFLSSPALKADMENAGVVSMPEIKIMKKV